MQSRWSGLKARAMLFRKRGLSLRTIEKRLGIPRSTLSGWFSVIELDSNKRRILYDKWRKALVKARVRAAARHRAEKEKRILQAIRTARDVVSKTHTEDVVFLESILAFLYLGEGTKNSYNVRMSNSNPTILQTFIVLLEKVYAVDRNQIRCGLNLRSDQKPELLKKFWSKSLNIPLRNFTYVIVDRRTVASKTYPAYKGVCMIRCGNVAIKRRIEAVSAQLCDKILKSSTNSRKI